MYDGNQGEVDFRSRVSARFKLARVLIFGSRLFLIRVFTYQLTYAERILIKIGRGSRLVILAQIKQKQTKNNRLCSCSQNIRLSEKPRHFARSDASRSETSQLAQLFYPETHEVGLERSLDDSNMYLDVRDIISKVFLPSHRNKRGSLGEREMPFGR